MDVADALAPRLHVRRYAVKVLSKIVYAAEKDREHMRMETDLMATVKGHPNVVRGGLACYMWRLLALEARAYAPAPPACECR